MFDTLFTGVLTLGLMISGAVAFASDFAASSQRPAPAAAVQVVTLPTVTVVAHRHAATPLRVASL